MDERGVEGSGADKPIFITPPPNLIPPRHDTQTQTQRAPVRKRELPVFLPASGAAPAAPPAPAQVAGPAPASQPGSAPAPPPRWQLVLPNGSVIDVTGSLLLGRNPVRFGPWNDATLVVLEDPTKSASKTHAVIQQGNDAITITDLHSTNGVAVVSEPGGERELTSEQAEAIPDGAVVWLGRFELRVRRS